MKPTPSQNYACPLIHEMWSLIFLSEFFLAFLRDCKYKVEITSRIMSFSAPTAYLLWNFDIVSPLPEIACALNQGW